MVILTFPPAERDIKNEKTVEQNFRSVDETVRDQSERNVGRRERIIGVFRITILRMYIYQSSLRSNKSEESRSREGDLARFRFYEVELRRRIWTGKRQIIKIKIVENSRREIACCGHNFRENGHGGTFTAHKSSGDLPTSPLLYVIGP